MPVPKTIKFGDKGAEVKLLQSKLALPVAGYGTFDAYTEQAVKNYQKTKGLTPDGIVGAKTWTALGVTNYTAPAVKPIDLLPGSIYPSPIPSGGSSGGNVAAGIAAGSRIRFTGNALTVLGTRAALVTQSSLDKINAALSRRGYTDASADSSYSEVTIEATLTTGKATTGTMAADFVAAGNEAGVPIGNARAEVVSAPNAGGVPNGNRPPSNSADNTILFVGAGLLIAVFLLKDK
jgi:hypothetical protein